MFFCFSVSGLLENVYDVQTPQMREKRELVRREKKKSAMKAQSGDNERSDTVQQSAASMRSRRLAFVRVNRNSEWFVFQKTANTVSPKFKLAASASFLARRALS